MTNAFVFTPHFWAVCLSYGFLQGLWNGEHRRTDHRPLTHQRERSTNFWEMVYSLYSNYRTTMAERVAAMNASITLAALFTKIPQRPEPRFGVSRIRTHCYWMWRMTRSCLGLPRRRLYFISRSRLCSIVSSDSSRKTDTSILHSVGRRFPKNWWLFSVGLRSRDVRMISYASPTRGPMYSHV